MITVGGLDLATYPWTTQASIDNNYEVAYNSFVYEDYI